MELPWLREARVSDGIEFPSPEPEYRMDEKRSSGTGAELLRPPCHWESGFQGLELGFQGRRVQIKYSRLPSKKAASSRAQDHIV